MCESEPEKSKNTKRGFVPPNISGTTELTEGEIEYEPDPEIRFAHISAKVKISRRAFVAEYFKDFNAAAAMMRMGAAKTKESASTMSSVWMYEPFTQYVLSEYVDKAENEALISRNQIVAKLMREADHYGPDGNSASRVGALRALSKIYGMEVQKVQHSVEGENSGVMLVPMLPKGDWEKHATAAQEALKASNGAPPAKR